MQVAPDDTEARHNIPRPGTCTFLKIPFLLPPAKGRYSQTESPAEEFHDQLRAGGHKQISPPPGARSPMFHLLGYHSVFLLFFFFFIPAAMLIFAIKSHRQLHASGRRQLSPQLPPGALYPSRPPFLFPFSSAFGQGHLLPGSYVSGGYFSVFLLFLDSIFCLKAPQPVRWLQPEQACRNVFIARNVQVPQI